MTMRSSLCLLALLWTAAASLAYADESTNEGYLSQLWKYATSIAPHNYLRRGLTGNYHMWDSAEIHSTLLQWKTRYPNLVRVTTGQERYGLQRAGGSGDCPFDNGTGCLNYFITIQDYLVHPPGTPSSNALPEVLWSGELHGNERVGPTAVMEAASLLLEAAQCESSFSYNRTHHSSCSDVLYSERGIDKKQRQWLARLVTTRRIVVVPTANALGYYQNLRTEGSVDINRDFPFDYPDGSSCMQSIGGRTLNEIFREHMFQLALTFHGGIEMIGYEWGATSFFGKTSPDDEAQFEIASAYARFGGDFSFGYENSANYRVGPMDQLVYVVKGGMEDWAYAGSWIPDMVKPCEPTTYGGYPKSKTEYNDAMLRSFNMLVETSSSKEPSSGTLGTSHDVLTSETSGNGHVSRNVRVSLSSADLVEPYLSFVGVNDLALAADIIPLMERPCRRMNAVKVPASFAEVTVEWTVGGVLEIDDTRLYYGSWNSVADVGCLMQTSVDLSSKLTEGLLETESTGTGYFSRFGVSPAPTTSATEDSPMGPVFKATVNLSQFSVGDEVAIFVKARVDQSWAEQPSGVVPTIPPQAHIVNARTNPNWYYTNNGKVIKGRQDWYSVVPLTLVITNTTTKLEDLNAPAPARRMRGC